MAATERPARPQPRAPRAGRIVLLTFVALFAATAGLVLAAALAPPASDRPSGQPGGRVALSESTLAALAAAAARDAEAQARAAVEASLDPVFRPVHASVGAYADFHFSVLGEYTELTEAALRSVSTSMEERLFAGFDARLDRALSRIDAVFAERFKTALARRAQRRAGPTDDAAPLAAACRAALADTVARARIAKPVGLALAGGGAVAGKTVAGLVSKGALKITGKLAGKLALKSAGAGASTGAGAALGSLLGPAGTVIGAVAGGTAAWFGLDYAVIRIDELLTRDAFEAELHALIAAEHARIAADIRAALAARRAAVAGETIGAVRETDDAGAQTR